MTKRTFADIDITDDALEQKKAYTAKLKTEKKALQKQNSINQAIRPLVDGESTEYN